MLARIASEEIEDKDEKIEVVLDQKVKKIKRFLSSIISSIKFLAK